MQALVLIVFAALLASCASFSGAQRRSLQRHYTSLAAPLANKNSFSRIGFGKISVEDISLEEQERLVAEEAEREKALVQRVNAEVLALTGVELEELINPSKVVNLERDLVNLEAALSQATSEEERAEIEKNIEKKQKTLFVEKRAVMRGWLKNLFVFQSVLAGVVSLGMVYDCIPGYSVPLSVQVLGFWMWWLFIVPSLRARKPVAQEKTALNVAFLATPVVSLALPLLTRDVALLWWANAATVALCYLYGFSRSVAKLEEEQELEQEGGEQEQEGGSGVVRALKQAFRALDYGSGQERGLRK